jgi:signal transduction histidine kinase
MNVLRHIRRTALAIPVIVLAAALLLIINETAHRQAINSVDELGRIAAVRVDNMHLLRLVMDAETGQRGYLLTGREEFLMPQKAAVSEIHQTLGRLHAHYEQVPEHLGAYAELESEVKRRLSTIDTTIEMHQAGNRDGALELELSGIGKEQMDDIRSESDKLVAIESVRIAAEREEIYGALTLGRIGVAATTLLSVMALMMYLRQTDALTRQRREQQRQMREERDQLELQVRERTEQLTNLARHLQTAREDERSRLARDLHDELGALLTAAKLDAARLKSRIPDITPEATERLDHLNATLNSGIALKRRIIEDLRPSSLSNLGLVAALEIQAREFSERSGLDVKLDLEPVSLSEAAELTVYRLVQEALTNIAKYAQATTVTISLGMHDDEQVEVIIVDDGIGFDPQERPRSAHGLLGMHYRVESEGGRLSLTSSPGQGTRIAALLPQQDAHAVV